MMWHPATCHLPASVLPPAGQRPATCHLPPAGQRPATCRRAGQRFVIKKVLDI